MMIIIKYWRKGNKSRRKRNKSRRKKNKSRSKETVATLGADPGRGGGGHRIQLKVCIVPSFLSLSPPPLPQVKRFFFSLLVRKFCIPSLSLNSRSACPLATHFSHLLEFFCSFHFRSHFSLHSFTDFNTKKKKKNLCSRSPLLFTQHSCSLFLPRSFARAIQCDTSFRSLHLSHLHTSGGFWVTFMAVHKQKINK